MTTIENFDEKLMWLMIFIGLLCGVFVSQRSVLKTLLDSSSERKHSDQ